MQPQVTVKTTWFEAELDGETFYLISEDYNPSDHGEKIAEHVGYGARISAPGYCDCTEWAVYDTEKEAWEGLLEMYPDTFTWYWKPGHGYHFNASTIVLAEAMQNMVQSIDGVRIEGDDNFLYTVDGRELPESDDLESFEVIEK